MIRHGLKLFAAAALLAGFTAQSHAAAVVQQWDLFNFPSGSLGNPDYGLRLDGLFNTSLGADHDWSFSFEDGSGNSTVGLTLFDDASVNISGTVFGGRDIGSQYETSSAGIWNLDFTFQGVSSGPASADFLGLELTGAGNSDSTALGSGTLESTYDVTVGSTSLGAGTINFVTHSNGAGLFFNYALGLIQSKCLSDGTPEECDRAIGVGWLTHGIEYSAIVDDNNTERFPSSDYQFTGQLSQVPVPAALPLLATAFGLIGLVTARRRQKAA